jgi:hypothetical protein
LLDGYGLYIGFERLCGIENFETLSVPKPVISSRHLEMLLATDEMMTGFGGHMIKRPARVGDTRPKARKKKSLHRNSK